MLRQDLDEEDLRTEIYSLRKHIARVCSENQILKVKIRKLQDEMIKRDKQLDEFLSSKRFFGFSKNLQDKGASVLMNLKVKNDKMEQSLLEKDMMIKRLQNTLQTAKLYNANSLNRKLASKGVECTLLNDNKFEYRKKGSMNTKIELHMPTFDIGDCESAEEIYDSRRDVAKMNKKNANSVESKFLLDINLDLKQTTKPTYCSETRFQSRSASYHMEAKGSNSEGIIEKFSEEYIPVESERNKKMEHKKELNYRSQKDVEEDAYVNPAFQKILQTIEEIMTRGTNTDLNISRTVTIDESVQFPVEEQEIMQILDSPSEVVNETSNAPSQEHHPGGTEKILENEQPPSILDEIQVQDQSDCEANSVSEKTDRMEKSASRVPSKRFLDKEMPHEEIKQLHVYLLDMISQVDCLKDTISQMKADQERTETDLKSKDESIDKLAKEIEALRELRSLSSNQVPSDLELAEKDSASVESYEILQKTTQQNIKKIAGKMKHLRETKSKSSISSQTEKKQSRGSSRSSKPEKRKPSDKSNKKGNRKAQEKVIGIGNGDVVDVPFYRCGLPACSAIKSARTEYDELD
ncbi:autophagy-related protein 23-like isoform X2 [Coccinella septempunctata]|uniref:autophagy-related protein 23-like isoform X2 n=1 Tax=Coccinella septempunctata TaxID=41139 RepID=UPI001D081014|nr:autophagy-related protein 23-like isoform X2 [Coccinella septempunctata]